MALQQSDISVTRYVVGPGALGLFLVSDIVEKTGQMPVVVGRRTGRRHWRVSAQGKPQDFSAEVLSQRELETRPVFGKELYYVCVRTEDAHRVTRSLCHAVHKRAGGNNTCAIVYLSNGLFPSALTETYSEIEFYRAIVIAGFQMQRGATDCVVHNGGSSIRFGALTQCAALQRVVPCTNLLEWECVENISAVEQAKFFVNFALALFIGPRTLPNEKIFELATQEELRALAVYVAQRFGRQGEEESYLRELQFTVKATGGNLNSFSKAGVEGNSQSFMALLDQLPSQKDDKALPLISRVVAKNWKHSGGLH